MTLNSKEFVDGSFGLQGDRDLTGDHEKLSYLKRKSGSDMRALAAQADGRFAVALHLDDGTSIAAVDRFAQASVCYRIVGDRIHFAERADLLADPLAELNPQALFDYLYFHAIPSPSTVFKGVYRVPPGHCLVFANGNAVTSPYWQPEFKPQHNVSVGALKEEFLSLLEQACAAQIQQPVACFLSGGTDSSTVSGMVSRIIGRGVPTYSIGFEADGYDEMAYARVAAKHFGTDHHEYYVTPDDLVRTIPLVAAHYDQPFGNSSAVPAFHCARMAADDGVAKILAGDGGDELFGGNKRYATQRVLGLYDGVPSWGRTGLEALLRVPGLTGVPLLRKAASYVNQARVPMPDRLQTYNLLVRLGIDNVLERRFIDQVDVLAPVQHQRETWNHSLGASLLDRQLAFDWRYTLAENDLPKVCGTTRLAGVDVGFPMLDRRLVDFSMTLPPSFKLNGLKLRWFFKEALRGFLPDQIISKKKQGFGLPFGVWAVGHPPLAALARESLASLSARGFVRPAFTKNLLDHQLPQHPGYYGEMVWVLMMLEHWLRRHAPDFRMEDRAGNDAAAS